MSDTIAAFATPPGIGGVAVLRISGPDAGGILRAMFRHSGGSLASHVLTYGRLVDPSSNEIIDECMAVFMRAPRTFTREDVAEIHCHGGLAVMDRALRVVRTLGARIAEPGEFTRRAFENGRIDLTQAEAVMRLIGARGEAAARAAVRQLAGGASRFVKEVTDELITALAGIEAALDFPDEIEEQETAARVADLSELLAHKLMQASDPRAGRVLDDGLDAVIAGPPNAGKSSLLNALLEEDRAIVHSAPGTTRDVLTAEMTVAGLRVRLSDTAGLRETVDPVESIGVNRARARLANADLVLMMIDAAVPFEADGLRAAASAPLDRMIILLNKCDIGVAADESAFDTIAPDVPRLRVSAKTGEGLGAVRDLIAKRALALAPESAILSGARHAQAAQAAARSLREAAASLRGGGYCGAALDLAAIDLRAALRGLESITGVEADEAVIDRIFSTFCVGK
ncbi:MAG: tRNA uridine-5-carboxymethylaminomethyl(34) synthesis GTPase MnmE [Oscillospiraceae bacterium]|nr:tRNA uridine-5-carboxymethylaminomethyl(34) synthesis GTPase MnmE [Oscillospiraceae bacterium]